MKTENNVRTAPPFVAAWTSTRAIPYGGSRLKRLGAGSGIGGAWASSGLAACILLTFCALFGTVYASAAVFTVVVVVGTAIACWGWAALLLNPQMIRFSWLLGCGLLFEYSFGSAFATALVWYQNEMSLADYFTRSQSALSGSYAVVLVAVLFLIIIGCFEPPVLKEWVAFPIGARERRLVFAGSMVVVAAVVTGQFGYMGVVFNAKPSDAAGALPILGTLAVWLCPGLMAYTTLVITRSKGFWVRLPLIGAVFIQLVALLLADRRAFAYGMSTSLIACGVGWCDQKRSVAKRLTLIAIALTLSVAGMAAFHSLRVSINIMSGWGQKDVSLRATAEDAVSRMVDDRSAEVRAGVLENVKWRGFILDYLSDLYAALPYVRTMDGGVVLYSLRVATPSVVYPEKTRTLQASRGMEEGLVNPHFGLPVQDRANTVLTSGISDFGVLGALGYPVVLAIAYSWLIRRTRRIFPKAVHTFVMFAAINLISQPEASLPTYFVFVRDCTLLAVIACIIYALPAFFHIQAGLNEISGSGVVTGAPVRVAVAPNRNQLQH